MRTKTLVHCISVERDSVLKAYNTIRKELGAYNPKLLDKKEIVVITKSDMVTDEALATHVKEIESIADSHLVVSVLDDGSVQRLSDHLTKELSS